DLVLAVGEGRELPVQPLQRLLVEVVAQLAVTPLQGVAARMLPEHEGRARYADLFRAHDLVGQAVLHHAVLVDARLVRKRVAADPGLVGPWEAAGAVRRQPPPPERLLRI